MSEISINQAKEAKEFLKAQIGPASWLRGIGIGFNDSGYCVALRVAQITEELIHQIPAEIDGVEVDILAVGSIRPLSSTPQVILQVEEEPTFCSACDEPLENFSLMVCEECLGHGCDLFSQIVETL